MKLTADRYIKDMSIVFCKDPDSFADMLVMLILLGERNLDGSFRSSMLDLLTTISNLQDPKLYWSNLHAMINHNAFGNICNNADEGIRRIQMLTMHLETYDH